MSREDNKRIAKNTTALYIRMFIGMAVSLYTSRVILEILGVENFGVYNVVGGVVSLFSFLNASMSGATSRFITFELGRGNNTGLKGVFNSAMFVHILIALSVVIICETFGIWLLQSKLEIPQESRNAAMWVFQCSIAGTAISVTQIPYTACIIAHEKMSAFAYIDLLNTFLKLGIVYLLTVLPGNKLQVYGILVLILSTSIALIYRIYCIRNFKECRLSLKSIEKSDMKAMLSFSGWNLYGSMSTVVRNQGVAILANIFFGAIANAAIGISNQVQGIVNAFATNITMAIKPQIIKSYASREYERYVNLINWGSKISFFLMFLVALPIIVEMPYILELWLKTVPEYTVSICRLTLIFVLFSNISLIAVSGVHATGKIKRATVINGSLYLSIIPISFIAYKYGKLIYLPFYLDIIFVFGGAIVNLYYATKWIPDFAFIKYMCNILARCVMITITGIIVIGYLQCFETQSRFVNLLITICESSLCVTIISYFSLFNKPERYQLIKLFRNIIHFH